MANASYTLIRGNIVLLGKSPDGDSVRFDPDDMRELRALQFGSRLKPSKDGTVQLRLDAIDAPETHYSGEAQPLGSEVRSSFLEMLGFSTVRFSASGKVTTSKPNKIPAAILAKMVEVHGRPVAYLFVGEQPQLKSRRTVVLTASILERSANATMVLNGLAYPTLYTSTPLTHREVFTALAATARIQKRGVWVVDATNRFALKDQASIGPGGQLILPKLFRRCTDYLTAKENGSTRTFVQWLADATSGNYPEDDELFVGTKKTRLSKVVEVQGNVVHFAPDLLDIVFIEK